MVIAVITPTYNEQDNIETLSQAIFAEQINLDPGDELHHIISDSHSPDKTEEIARRLESQNDRVHFIDVKERGIGIGIVEGFRYGVSQLHSDVLISMDADLSHPPSTIPTMVKKIKEGNDLIVGSRYAKGGSNNYGLYRKLQSYTGNQIIRILLGVYNLNEFLTSYRALTSQLFEKADLSNVPWRSKTFVFQPTFLYELLRHNPRYVEVPFVFVNRRQGRSKMNTMRYIRDVLTFALKARAKKSKQFLKFLAVGGTGFLINTIGLVIFDKVFHIDEAVSASIGAEIAIISNFILNNFWTFRDNRVTRNNVIQKFLQFNLSSAGAILIQFVTITLGKTYITPILPLSEFWKQESSYVYYVIAVGIGLIYNYIMYSRIIWRKKPASHVQS